MVSLSRSTYTEHESKTYSEVILSVSIQNIGHSHRTTCWLHKLNKDELKIQKPKLNCPIRNCIKQPNQLRYSNECTYIRILIIVIKNNSKIEHNSDAEILLYSITFIILTNKCIITIIYITVIITIEAEMTKLMSTKG